MRFHAKFEKLQISHPAGDAIEMQSGKPLEKLELVPCDRVGYVRVAEKENDFSFAMAPGSLEKNRKMRDSEEMRRSAAAQSAAQMPLQSAVRLAAEKGGWASLM